MRRVNWKIKNEKIEIVYTDTQATYLTFPFKELTTEAFNIVKEIVSKINKDIEAIPTH